MDSNDDPQGYSEAQVIGTWKITGLSADIAYDWDGNGIPETNLYTTLPACEKDNLYSFNQNMTGSFKRNCSTTQAGEWEIYRTGLLTPPFTTSFLVLAPDNAPEEMEKMVSMTSIQFVTTRQIVAPSGQTITLSKTWSRQ